jgi:hypothetical protein
MFISKKSISIQEAFYGHYWFKIVCKVMVNDNAQWNPRFSLETISGGRPTLTVVTHLLPIKCVVGIGRCVKQGALRLAGQHAPENPISRHLLMF